MKLAAYLSAKKIQRSDFAEEVNITPGWVTALCDGSKQPSMRVAERIAKVTKGAVMPNDFIAAPRALQRASV